MGVNKQVPPSDRPVLAGGRLGTAGILFFALAAATPLTVVAATIPAAYAGGLLLVPLGFLAVGLILLVFSVGYTAMIRRGPTAGALYAVIARGLGRPLGVAAAWVALLSYNALQIGLYGALSAAAGPLLTSRFGITVPWWQSALAGWAVVALLGLVRAALAGWLLAVLVLAETVVIIGFSAADLLDPAGGRITVPRPDLGHLDRPALGLLLIGAALAFVGFETAAAYGQEARHPRRALGRATGLAVLVLTVLYTGAAWAMSVGTGSAKVAAVSAERGPELLFDLAAARLAPWAVTLGRMLLLTGTLAAMIALHHTIARYTSALGRDRVLPRWLGRTTRRTGTPRAASLAQTTIAGAVIGGYARWSPHRPLAGWLGVAGGIGVLLLLAAVSLAALLFLNRAPDGENAWRRFLAPGCATIAFGTLGYLAFANLAELLGVRPGDPLTRIVPGAFGVAVLLGIGYGLTLRKTRPIVYAGIGLGGTAVVISPTSAPVPKQRTPGAHRPERINRELTQ